MLLWWVGVGVFCRMMTGTEGGGGVVFVWWDTVLYDDICHTWRVEKYVHRQRNPIKLNRKVAKTRLFYVWSAW